MKLKLLFLPRYHANPNTGEKDFPPHYPPLGTSTLKSFMDQNKEKHSFQVDQDDLDIKTVDYNKGASEEEKIDLEKFFDEERIDKFFEKGEDEELEREAAKIVEMTDLKGYDVVGLSLMPTDNPSTAGVALAVAKKIKEWEDPTIILGGSVRSKSEPERRLLKSGYIDYRILGSPSTSSGEYNLLDFCRKYESGEIMETRGLVTMKNGEYFINHFDYSEEKEANVTLPKFEGLPIELYRRSIEREANNEIKSMDLLVLPFFFIRSCPHNCSFCSNSRVSTWGKEVVEKVVDKLAELKKKYDTKYFFFHNPSINPSYQYAEKFAEEVIERDLDIQWSDCANFSPLDRSLLKKLKGAGAGRLVFGFESASPQILRYINKPFTVDQASKTLKMCDELDIWTELDMICGFPYESDYDTMASLKFLEEHKSFIDGCYLNKFWVEGQFKEKPERFGIELKDTASTHINWSGTPFDEIYGLDWEERIKMTEQTFERLQSYINGNFPAPPHIHEFFFEYNKGG